MNPTDQLAAEDEAFENIVTAILQCQKGTARQFFKSAIEKATDFYKRRCDALQQAQKEMRDPERQMVCDILANGYRDKAIEASRAAKTKEGK